MTNNKTDDQPKSPRPLVAVIAILLVLFVVMALVELMSSQVLMHRYRHIGTLNDGRFSSLVLLHKAAFALGWTSSPTLTEFRLESTPSPFQKLDPVFGYAAIPGAYTHDFKRQRVSDGRWETLPVKVTINPDGSRWTGLSGDPQKPTIYILGDSFAFGTGVNDEQSFAYHLQMARPNYNVKLYALGGYGLVHSYLKVLQLKPEITDRDIVVIGYADFYDVRNVAAPSRLRELDQKTRARERLGETSKTPKASIGTDDKLSIALVDQDCRVARSYCALSDPSPAEMSAVSTRLIREIAQATKAKTYLLHLDGTPGNPVAKNGSAELISTLQDDFGYFSRDDVEGFDQHPGPYWHYAVAQKLITRIK